AQARTGLCRIAASKALITAAQCSGTGKAVTTTTTLMSHACSAQRAERRAQLFGEQLRLFPGGEVAAPFGLVEVDQVVVACSVQLRGAWTYSSGNTVTAAGRETSAG